MNAKRNPLFQANCAACHSTTAKTVVGPGLQGCFDRFPHEGWFIDFMLNQDSLRELKDPYLLSLKEEYPITDEYNHNLSGLTENELEELETFLKK
ncbi:MAG: c-type cytochrome [Vicingaceae bacterium]